MKHLLTFSAILCLGMAVGCTSGEGTKQEPAAAKPAAQETHSKPAESTPANSATAQNVSGTEVQLTGKMGCGHCNFHIGETCSAAMQTADGKIYVIDGVSEESEVFKNRMSGKEITVAGVVKDVNGIAHIDAKSIL